ncbi:MTOR-associated protein MEAK7 isoform X3 [Petromyzon marinus]|uniref:MTOR-associated protein MEAK7 isoform X3 n=1 Tax=Petromyzon marinus TaxID=7757 RepID=UPI003F70A14A
MGNAMGGGGAALQQQLARFRPEERATLSRGYDSIAHTRGPGAASTAAAAGKAAKQQGPGEGFNVAALRQFVQPALPEVLLLSLFRGMSHAYDPTLKKPAPAAEYVCQERFVRFVASVLRGGAEEQAATLCWMVGERNGGVASQQVHQLVQELLEVAVQALHHGKLLRGWQLDKMADTREGAALVATALLAEIRRSDGSTADTASGATTRDDVSGWLHRTPLVPALLSLLVTSSLRLELGHGHNLLPLPTEPAPSSSSSPSSDDNGGGGGAGPSAETPAPDEDPRRALAPLLVPPACEGVAWSQLGVGSGGGGGRGPRLLLDVPSMLHLGVHLPGELRDRWRLLFSSRLQGESFSRLCGLAVGQGPTLLLVEDVDGHLFGGFASASWEVKPQFQAATAFCSACGRPSACTPARATTTTTCTSTTASRPCPTDLAWAGSTTTLGCGWTVTTGVGTAAPSRAAPPTAAPSCRLARSSPSPPSRCGGSAVPPNAPKGAEARPAACWTLTRRCRPCWRWPAR